MALNILIHFSGLGYKLTHGSLEQLKQGPENISFSSVFLFKFEKPTSKHVWRAYGFHCIGCLDKCVIAQVIK